MTPEQHRARRRARILRMRKRVAAVSVIVFIALFSTIYVQMALGHDPVLGSHKAPAAKANDSSAQQQDTTTTTQQQQQPQQDTTTQQSPPSAVTTSQS
jgi:hypothetical protein